MITNNTSHFATSGSSAALMHLYGKFLKSSANQGAFSTTQGNSTSTESAREISGSLEKAMDEHLKSIGLLHILSTQ